MFTPLNHFSVLKTPAGVAVLKHDFIGGNFNQIAPGVPVEPSSVVDFFSSLDGVGEVDRGFIPISVIFQSRGLVAWVVKGARRTMLFNASGRNFEIETALPTLVLASNGSFISAVAVKDSTPTSESVCFYAPLFNFFDNTKMCQGSVSLPRQAPIEDLKSYEDCVFETRFSHSNHPDPLKGVEGRDDVAYVQAMRNIKGQFPDKLLCPINLTLSQWIGGLQK